MHILWTTTSQASALDQLARRLLAELTKEERFCLWLNGPLGAGKTTLTGAMLRQLGLAADEPVTSPTYAIMNEYEIAGAWYAHLDLYRTRGELSLEEIGLADARIFRGVFIEWPELIPDDPYLKPTHILDIAFPPDSLDTPDSLTRTYTLSTPV